jgi:hypothetical protein
LPPRTDENAAGRAAVETHKRREHSGHGHPVPALTRVMPLGRRAGEAVPPALTGCCGRDHRRWEAAPTSGPRVVPAWLPRSPPGGRDGSGRRLPEPIANQGMGPCRQTTGVRRSAGSCASASAFDGGREWLDPPAVGSSRQGNLTSRPKPHRVDAGWQCAVCRTPIAGLASAAAPCASWAGVGGLRAGSSGGPLL